MTQSSAMNTHSPILLVERQYLLNKSLDLLPASKSLKQQGSSRNRNPASTHNRQQQNNTKVFCLRAVDAFPLSGGIHRAGAPMRLVPTVTVFHSIYRAGALLFLPPRTERRFGRDWPRRCRVRHQRKSCRGWQKTLSPGRGAEKVLLSGQNAKKAK